MLAKLPFVWRGYCGNKIGKLCTCSMQGDRHRDSGLAYLIPALRGTGVISAPFPQKLLLWAGISDCHISARGCTATLGNFAKATFDAISKTYSYLTPELWKEAVFKTHTRVSI
ncbi:hypothetical protein U0070_000500 [Myodes glareolus]|uniref:Small ribosomal subunit protein uS5 n=1 Tax=Myodes glareolus TaxID=447135 RepID=A0AAW0IIT0_MYOGA